MTRSMKEIQDQWREQFEKADTKLKQKENTMNNNTDKVMGEVKENVNKMVKAGKEAATNPRLIGEKLANTFNKMHDTKAHAKVVYDNKKDQVKDAFKLGFSIIKEGLKEVKAGYTETRYKKDEVKPKHDHDNDEKVSI